MLNHLIASQGRRRELYSPGLVTLSMLFHAVVVAGVAVGTVQSAQQRSKETERVTFIDVKPQAPEPKAPEPPPEPPKETPATPPPPKGFQELIPPKEPPPAIPDVDLSQPAVNVEDFSGVGRAGGVAKGVEGGTPQQVAAPPVDSSTFAYEVAVLERVPELINKSQVASMLSRFYPRMLQDAGIGGQTVMQFVITKEGQVDVGTVKVISTSHEQFAEASTKVVERFRFRPGRYKGEAVRVLIQMPITWQPQS